MAMTRKEPVRVTVIGDNFMLPEAFVASLNRNDGIDFEITQGHQPWPDVDMTHGYDPAGRGSTLDHAGLADLKEYFGTPEEVIPLIERAEILICHLPPITQSVIEAAPDLKLIGISRGGPVNIDMAAARTRGIHVVNTPGRNAGAVAEFTIGMILTQTRLITTGHTALSTTGDWSGHLYRADTTGRELGEMTVGVIGYGHIGTKVVRHLKSFGCRILVCDPYVQLSPTDLDDGVVQVSLDTILDESDVVTMHPRVTSETTGMIGKAEFGKMKDGAYFINTARGPLVDYDALYEALTNGKLAGAGLETFGIEPVPTDSPLLKLPNVTLTPHIAGASVKTVTNAADMIAEDVRRFLSGEPLINLVP
ncbi:MAG: 2-hydroxyacid dehydrogenase [Pseudomonadota bacterium]